MLRQGVSYVERSCRACTLDFLRQHQTSLTVLRPFHTSLSNARRPGNASNNRGEPSNYAPKNGHGDRSARFGGRDGGRPGQRRPGRPGGSNKLPRETRPAPTLEQLRTTLGRRIGPWTSSEQTMKQLAAIGMEVEDSEILLMEFEAIASRSLDRSIFGTKLGASSSEYRVDWDVEGLSIALQHDADWSRAVERSYLRQFLKWVSREEVVTGQFTSILTSSTVLRIREILAATDLSHLSSQYTEAREMKRQFHLHIGPTNSGKTYNALKALATAKTGAYAGPLRLLAHEVWERLNRGTVGGLEEGKGRECNLITGEERRIVSLEAGLTSCTVEMLSLSQPVDVVVIDEIQMIGDAQRGASWTNAVMGLMAKEIHLCGEETVVPVITKLVAAMGDELVIHRYERLTPLKVLDQSLEGDLSKIEDGDCVVSFSRAGIFALKKVIEEKRGKRCAVVYGALPPETRSEQAKLFNEPGNGIDVMVASDAVGMGLNLKIKRIIFETLRKWNGKEEVLMSFSQIKQIAGRAGRYGQHSAGSEGGVTTLVENDLALLRDILPSPLTPVPRAVVEPGHERLAELSLLLPDEIPYGRLLEIYESLVHMSPACMPAAVLPHIKLSELLRAFTKDLTLKEMATFGFAPVNVRDNKVVATFQNYVQAYVKEGEVDILEALESSRLIPNLELVELTRSTMKDPGSEQRPGTIPPPIPAAIVIAIPGLESLHKALVLYIWLSFRLELNFPDRAEATALKLRTEAMLDFCLERLPGLKRKKLPKTSHKTKAERLAEQEALQQLPLNTTRKIDWIPREKINALRQQSQYSNLDVLPDTRL